MYIVSSAASGSARLIVKLFGDDLLPLVIVGVVIALIVAAFKKD